ncbi:MAG TPA: hypothetical protein VF280_10550 [Burkholderiales bacterium]|jgi:hypothetical protein
MSPAFVTIGLFFWLAVFVAIGWVVNRVLKRPAINGAGLYAVAALAVLVINIAIVTSASPDPERIGTVVGSFLLPLLLAAFLSHRFQKRRKMLAAPKDAAGA